MRVVLAAKCVYPFHPAGGVQKYVYYFARSLKKQGVDVTVVAPLDQGRPRIEKLDGIDHVLLSPAIYSYLEYPIGWLGVHLFNQRLAQFLRSYSFDVAHCFDMVSFKYLSFALHQPVVSQIFTDNYLTNPIATINPFSVFSLLGKKTASITLEKIKIAPDATFSTKMQYPAQFFFKVKPMQKVLTRSNAVFFEDQSSQKEVEELFKLKNENHYVVPVGIDLEGIEKKLAKKVLSREDMGLLKDDLVLITVNRLAADKGVDKIVQALKLIRLSIPQVKLIMIGQGYQEKEIYRLIAEHRLESYIRHVRNVSEDRLYDYYALSDLYICAFSYPGSSISTLEAMACCLPILTTAQPWLIEGNGLLMSQNTPETIQAGVVELFNRGQLKAMGQKSYQIAKKFSWDLVALQAIKYYTQILS